MPEKKFKIVSTKKLSVEQQGLFNKDIVVTDLDFIEITYNELPEDLSDQNLGNVIITSQNALKSLVHNFKPKQLKFISLYCVGSKTKAAIEKELGPVTHYEDTVAALAKYLVKNLADKKVTYFSGNLRRDELKQTLLKHAVEVDETEVYQTHFVSNPLNQKFDAILFFSPSGIQSYLMANKAADEVIFSIGPTTAVEATEHFDTVLMADEPTVENVIFQVNDYYKNIDNQVII